VRLQESFVVARSPWRIEAHLQECFNVLAHGMPAENLRAFKGNFQAPVLE
jgi:hypothetical protein